MSRTSPRISATSRAALLETGNVRFSLTFLFSRGALPNFLSFHTVSVWAAVDQGLSDRIAKAVGASSVKPLKVKPASEAVRFRANLGLAAKQQ